MEKSVLAKLALTRGQILFFVGMAIIFCAITFGFGYFFGRYEQIQINKSLLKIIPEVNCGVNDL